MLTVGVFDPAPFEALRDELAGSDLPYAVRSAALSPVFAVDEFRQQRRRAACVAALGVAFTGLLVASRRLDAATSTVWLSAVAAVGCFGWAAALLVHASRRFARRRRVLERADRCRAALAGSRPAADDRAAGVVAAWVLWFEAAVGVSDDHRDRLMRGAMITAWLTPRYLDPIWPSPRWRPPPVYGSPRPDWRTVVGLFGLDSEDVAVFERMADAALRDRGAAVRLTVEVVLSMWTDSLAGLLADAATRTRVMSRLPVAAAALARDRDDLAEDRAFVDLGRLAAAGPKVLAAAAALDEASMPLGDIVAAVAVLAQRP